MALRRANTLQTPIDVAVIGGGAAGLIAAIEAARTGARVVILEKNPQVGKKLSITGGGRCNITNQTPDVRALLSQYKDAGKFLFSPFAQFGVLETRAWFAAIGIVTVEQAERRVFPVSERASDVTAALLRTARAFGVTILTNTTVRSLKSGTSFRIETAEGILTAPRVILATGGTSHRETGSTGDGLPWLQALGHTIVMPQSALVPVAVKQAARTAKLGGVSLGDAGITIYTTAGVHTTARGKVLFTHFGLSGPGILNVSSSIADALTTGPTTIGLDLVPARSREVLEADIRTLIAASPNKLIRNLCRELLPGALVVPVMEAGEIPLDVAGHSLTVPLRRALVAAIKQFRFEVAHLLGPEHAIVTSGGVALPEVDFKTMESRLVPGLYIVGDVLNIDRPSGGYSLQLCWTTGYVAGRHAALRPATA
jgi:predicted Rossmann fold flavoprotein